MKKYFVLVVLMLLFAVSCEAVEDETKEVRFESSPVYYLYRQGKAGDIGNARDVEIIVITDKTTTAEYMYVQTPSGGTAMCKLEKK